MSKIFSIVWNADDFHLYRIQINYLYLSWCFRKFVRILRTNATQVMKSKQILFYKIETIGINFNFTGKTPRAKLKPRQKLAIQLL